MADKPIYLPISPNAEVWKWGARHYFYNCHREGGDFDWFADNLNQAEGAPTADQVSAKWTFAGKWDPEGTMPSVLPFVSQPSPRDGSYKVQQEGTILNWIPSRNAISSSIYFGKSTKPEHQLTQNEHSFNPGTLDAKTTYYWRISDVTGGDTLNGPLWHFTTK